MERTGEFFGRSSGPRQFGAFAVSVTDYASGSALEWHAHSGPYLTYVARGGYVERVCDRVNECDRNSVIVHPAGEVHADTFRAATRCVNVQIDPQWLARWQVALGETRPMRSTAVSLAMVRLQRELQLRDGVSSMAAEGLLLELVAIIAREQQATGGVPSWLRDVRDEVATRFREPLTLSALASAANVHPVHLARAFRRHFGMTIGEMVRHRRVEFARAQIVAGAQLSDVAHAAGFADQSHLSRTFRALTGFTPAQYRRVQKR